MIYLYSAGVALFFLLPYWLWRDFLAVMTLKMAKDKGLLNPTAKALGTPILMMGYLRDFLCNIIHATIFFLDIPRELTVSARVKRLCADGNRYNKPKAIWFRDNLLKDFDPSGGHD